MKIKAKGSCNCGSVKFSITETLIDVYICHCSICRKSTGSSGIAVTVVSNDSLTIECGSELIQEWEKPNHDWQKNFCKICGSPLPGKNDDKRSYVPVSLLDSGHENLKVKHHMFVGSKADWEEVGDNGTQHKKHIKT